MDHSSSHQKGNLKKKKQIRILKVSSVKDIGKIKIKN